MPLRNPAKSAVAAARQRGGLRSETLAHVAPRDAAGFVGLQRRGQPVWLRPRLLPRLELYGARALGGSMRAEEARRLGAARDAVERTARPARRTNSGSLPRLQGGARQRMCF